MHNYAGAMLGMISGLWARDYHYYSLKTLFMVQISVIRASCQCFSHNHTFTLLCMGRVTFVFLSRIFMYMYFSNTIYYANFVTSHRFDRKALIN